MADTNIPNGAAPVAPTAPEAQTVTPAAPKGMSAEQAFAAREKQLRGQMIKMQQEKQAWEAKQKQYETDYVPKSRLKENPWEVLSSEGIGEQDLIRAMQSTPQDPVSKALYEKVRAMEAKLAASEQSQSQAQEQQFEDTKKAMSIEIKQSIAANKDYEMLANYEGADEAVLELIVTDFEKTGVLKDVDEACAEIENHLLEQAYKMAMLSKVQARVKPPQAETVAKPTPKQTQVTTSLRTLTNSLPTQPSGKSSEKERIARAMAAFKGQNS
jgi:hypothetical protein